MDMLYRCVDKAIAYRIDWLDEKHICVVRLFNGFYEGCPQLVIDLYGSTLLLQDYSKHEEDLTYLNEVEKILIERFPWITCVVRKFKKADDRNLRKGVISYGITPVDRVLEHNIWYAVDFMLNQDASLYLDTARLRYWLASQAENWRVLNLFAYTGSLGIAALAGGAEQVVQVDRSKKFLRIARESAILNCFDLGKLKLRANDFFNEVAGIKREHTEFDCVIVDPPIFSETRQGSIDLVNEGIRVINKVRPLVKDGGRLIVINNALFLRGQDWIQSLEGLCIDGFLEIEQLIQVDEHVTGFEQTIVRKPPAETFPFNHPTKITILKVRRRKRDG